MNFLADRVPLLNLDDLEEESSSGYDSPVFVSDSEPSLSASRGESDHSYSGSSSENDISSESDDEGDDLDDLEDPGETMHVTSTETVVNNIKYILSMPQLCDVTFEIGPQRFLVYGLKAVIGSRSKVLQDMMLQQSSPQMQRKTKKNNNQNISIHNYDIDVFRQFLNFVHTGSVVMDVTTVVGIACAAEEYDVPELSDACLGYLKRCSTTTTNKPVLQTEADRYSGHQVARKIKSILMKEVSQLKRRETVV
ncbi:serine-enriched protein-like [Mytilus trossulus]|uniref:serine-enriched protein-like n=1 Tax=Mytilus trossulus TaxID=6551 RepID=UPI0030060620